MNETRGTGQADVDSVADALLAAVEEETRVSGSEDPKAMALRDLGIEFVRRYNRLEVDGTSAAFERLVLFVANHGFGGCSISTFLLLGPRWIS